MKRFVVLCIILSLTLSLVGCSNNTSNVSIDYGTSELYTNEDIDKAIEMVKKEFSSFDGCELYSLSYAGDEVSTEELERINAKSDNEYTAYIVLNSRFQSPKQNSGGWEPDTEYTWRWYVAKDNRGNWELTGYGYG